ncbi:MAG TPA: hypothetical protein VF594_04520 [Rubricoccaceae bacterium]|jgi:hypothetical protein
MRRSARVSTLLACTVLCATARAQPAPSPGSCVLGRAQATLDIGDVEATVFNTGALFYGNSGTKRHFVPRLAHIRRGPLGRRESRR